MQQKQTFYTFFLNAEGRKVDFERWAYKHPETCLKKTLELLESRLYRCCTIEKDEAVKFVICDVDDTNADHPRLTFDLANLPT